MFQVTELISSSQWEEAKHWRRAKEQTLLKVPRDIEGKQDWRPMVLHIFLFIIIDESLLIDDKAVFILKQNFCF